MPIQPRSVLRPLFSRGQRPKEQHFHDWLDSFYHKLEDTINVNGWVFRSFLKDLRAEGTIPFTNAGTAMIDIPFSVSRLKAIRVFGNGQRGNPALPLTITISLLYLSDLQIAPLNGVPNDIPQLPQGAAGGFFRHALIGNLTVPLLTFPIVSPPAPGGLFDGTLTFPGTGIPLNFTTTRFFRLQVETTSNITFIQANNNYVYYGFQFE